tara:strand:+ start:317 stop:712 length:396 start_codon:yes stop_codon:yes gene_type:complete
MSNQDNRVRMQDILEDTIEHYSDSPRAMDKSGSCQYTDEVGNHCAVGRYLKPEFQTIEFFANDGVSVGSLTQDVDTYLRSNVLGLVEKFWSDLQDVHDDNNNWAEYDEGLTDVGKVRCNKMKKRIEAGGYD